MPVKNILVVDDSPTERFFTVDVLTKAGYQVTTAETGESRGLRWPRPASPI
jgi:twitching motility two-component system response regulator PilH